MFPSLHIISKFSMHTDTAKHHFTVAMWMGHARNYQTATCTLKQTSMNYLTRVTPKKWKCINYIVYQLMVSFKCILTSCKIKNLKSRRIKLQVDNLNCPLLATTQSTENAYLADSIATQKHNVYKAIQC